MTDQRKIVAIGASAGGLKAVQELLNVLPANFAAPIVLAIHSQPGSKLTEVLSLSRKDGPSICEIKDGDRLENGVVHVIPGGKHAFFKGESLQLSEVVRDSGFRPSVDALFMSLASTYGKNAVAVVLSGMLKDGMRGAQVVYDMGGVTIVQDPEDADYADMPQSVIRADHPQKVLSAQDLGHWLTELIGT